MQATQAPPKNEARPRLWPLAHERDRVDPITGIELPRDMLEASGMRGSLIDWSVKGVRGKSAKYIQAEQMELCKSSIYYWINMYAMTFVVRKAGEDGRQLKQFEKHIPMVTWPVQDYALSVIIRCIEDGEDLIIDKSRDMGASWLLIYTIIWYWMFKSDSIIGINSRVEDDVDKSGDPKSLMWKLDYVIKRLPEWMHPAPLATLLLGAGQHRTHLSLVNPKNGSVVRGYASSGHASRGGRELFEVFDEMAAQGQATASWEAAGDATNCRIGNSTPIGPGTEFTKQRDMGLKFGAPNIVVLGYWNHPDKGIGRTWMEDVTGVITNEKGTMFYETYWFRHQRPPYRARSTQDIAQNILIDHMSSGANFFNRTILANHRDEYAREPDRLCEIQLVKVSKPEEKDRFENRFMDVPHGRWRIWCEPRKDTNYVQFADPSYGKGKANSASMIMDRTSMELGAEFADPNCPPDELSSEMMKAGMIYGGQIGQALCGWEVNGPGETMFRDFINGNYTYVYYKRQIGAKGQPKSKIYGLRSTRSVKKYILGLLDRAFKAGQLRCYSGKMIEEAMEFTIYPDGDIGAASLQDELTGAREAHADRVISAAGCCLLAMEAPFYTPEIEVYPTNTMGHVAGHDQLEGKLPTMPGKRVYSKRAQRYDRASRS